MIRKAIYTILLLSFYCIGQAQNLPGAAGQISDQQLLQLYQRAQAAGMSESDIGNLLSKQGLSAAEITSVKKRLSQLQNTKQSTLSKGNIRDTIGSLRDTGWVLQLPGFRSKSNIYGMDFFNTPNQSFSPNFKIATPKNYILGTDDELIVTLTGFNEVSIQDKISVEGVFPLPHAGFVHLSGITIDEATKRIRNKLAIAYPAISSGKTQVFVSLGNIRNISISIIGEAFKPGTYTISSLASFFNALYLSGGPTDYGSLRKIELIRNNKVIEVIDFYSFLQKGTLDKNIRLEDQDIIRIPVYQKRVSLTGEVKKPAIYELSDKETLTELLNFAGGFSDNAYKAVAKVVEIGAKEKSVKDVAAEDFNDYIPKNADSIYFEKINARFENRIMLAGAVNRPGTYELTKGLTLKQLIQKADGLREDVFLSRGYIKRLTANADRQMLSFDLIKLMHGEENDIVLNREDSIVVLAKDSLKDIPSVTISGSVRAAGTYVFREGMKLEDLIALAGGFTINAANHRVEINRLKKNTADTLANKLIDLITLNVDSALQNTDKGFALQPLDYVFIPELLNYKMLGNVKIRGEVLYPGDYTLERRDEAVLDLVNRAGGISPLGSLSNLQVYRNGLRVGTNIFEDGAAKTERFLLLPNDSIYVPKNESFVQVNGAVFNQQIVSYESSRFLYYISAAGGVKENGKLKRAYIQYSNGMNKKIKHFLFFRSYPKVLPGSKIIVPEASAMEGSINLGQVSLYAGLVTTLVALISVIKNL